MPKGKSNDLTGGTGDVNPQYMRGFVQLPTGTFSPATGSTWVQVQLPIPISRLRQAQGKATVMELLKVFFAGSVSYQPQSPFQLVSNVTLTTKQSSSPVPFADPSVIAFSGTNLDVQASAIPAAGTVPLAYIVSGIEATPQVYDCTDGAGHGVLVATDAVFLGIQTVMFDPDNAAQWPQPTYTAANATAVMLYRFKEVTLQEYIGIVQSQQT